MYFSVNGFIGPNHGVMASSYGGAPTNENALTSQTQLPTGVWKQVVITGHNGDRTIYIDGFPAVSVTGGPIVAPQEMEPIWPSRGSASRGSPIRASTAPSTSSRSITAC